MSNNVTAIIKNQQEIAGMREAGQLAAEVIEMITKAVNIANSSEHSMATEDGNSKQLVMQTTQMITSCRGFFGARMNILSGLKSKKKRK